MSKAILEIDMPKGCSDCLMMDIIDDKHICKQKLFENHTITELVLGAIDWGSCKLQFYNYCEEQDEYPKRPSWCPLKPLKENYISVDWLKQNIPFQHEEDMTILLAMLESWNKHE